MNIQESMKANAANWIELAEKGEIDWDTASMLINAFELGMTEMALSLEDNKLSRSQISDEIFFSHSDVNSYIKNEGHDIVWPPNSKDKERRMAIYEKLSKHSDFSGRMIVKVLRETIGKEK